MSVFDDTMLVRTVNHQSIVAIAKEGTTPVSAPNPLANHDLRRYSLPLAGNTPPVRSNPPVNRPPPTS